jgi:hypothetical protein
MEYKENNRGCNEEQVKLKRVYANWLQALPSKSLDGNAARQRYKPGSEALDKEQYKE